MTAEENELERLLRAARIDDAESANWATSAEGERVLAAIHDAATDGYRSRGLRIRLPRTSSGGTRWHRPALVGLGAATVAAGLVTLAIVVPGAPTRHRTVGQPSRPSRQESVVGPRPSDLALAGYDTCSSALAGLRLHAAAQVTSYGLPTDYPQTAIVRGGLVSLGQVRGAVQADPIALEPAGDSAKAAAPVPAHSGTNDQEAGADEPDTVKTDGTRIVTVSGSTLHVTDTVSRKITGSLDLSEYAGADSAQLLMSGNRVLVLLGDDDAITPEEQFGPYRPYPEQTSGSTTVLLVDIASAQPHVVSMFRPKGQLVDARLADGTARLVVRNTPSLQLAPPKGKHLTAAERKRSYQRQVRRAPLSDWLPSWTVSSGSKNSTSTMPCTELSHPAAYTGLSMVTVYSVDPAAGFGDVAPVSLAADGSTVYATTDSLYVTSSEHPYAARDTTQIHRFDIHAPGRPVYLGSGSVPGYLADSYSMSDWDGALRLVTTNGSDHDLYVLDSATLRREGTITGLGKGEQLHAVRLLGDLGYVVTYEQLDPLFVLDLRDPHHPTLAGRLSVTGYSTYLHQVGTGRLLGVGEATVPSTEGPGLAHPIGLQVSLFDVDSPSHPSLLSRIIRKGPFSDGDIDPHAFLYWADSDTAVVPEQGYSNPGVLVVHVGHDTLTTLGTVTNPGTQDPSCCGNGSSGIQRTLVVGDTLWTFSAAGLQASDLSTLHRQAWLPFR